MPRQHGLARDGNEGTPHGKSPKLVSRKPKRYVHSKKLVSLKPKLVSPQKMVHSKKLVSLKPKLVSPQKMGTLQKAGYPKAKVGFPQKMGTLQNSGFPKTKVGFPKKWVHSKKLLSLKPNKVGFPPKMGTLQKAGPPTAKVGFPPKKRVQIKKELSKRNHRHPDQKQIIYRIKNKLSRLGVPKRCNLHHFRATARAFYGSS